MAPSSIDKSGGLSDCPNEQLFRLPGERSPSIQCGGSFVGVWSQCLPFGDGERERGVREREREGEEERERERERMRKRERDRERKRERERERERERTNAKILLAFSIFCFS